jgi:Mrp family chromosome partitioning ATPase
MLAADEKNVTPAQWNEIAADARQTLLGGVPPDVDLVVIDTPPSVGTVAALWARRERRLRAGRRRGQPERHRRQRLP